MSNQFKEKLAEKCYEYNKIPIYINSYAMEHLYRITNVEKGILKEIKPAEIKSGMSIAMIDENGAAHKIGHVLSAMYDQKSSVLVVDTPEAFACTVDINKEYSEIVAERGPNTIYDMSYVNQFSANESKEVMQKSKDLQEEQISFFD